MKLILLPGMDGTGELFTDFLKHFTDNNYLKDSVVGELLVIPLPLDHQQDHHSLAQYVAHLSTLQNKHLKTAQLVHKSINIILTSDI